MYNKALIKCHNNTTVKKYKKHQRNATYLDVFNEKSDHPKQPRQLFSPCIL